MNQTFRDCLYENCYIPNEEHALAFNAGELRMVGMSIAHSLDMRLYHGLQMRVSILLTSYRDAQKRHKLT